MKNGVFWVVTPCGCSYGNVPSSPILVISEDGGAKFLLNVGSVQEPHGVTSQETPFFIGYIAYCC
jgi:hypothetical protein